MSKNVKYVGDLYAELPSLGLAVSTGDVITVPDDFENGAFEPVDPVNPVKPAKISQPVVADTTNQ